MHLQRAMRLRFLGGRAAEDFLNDFQGLQLQSNFNRNPGASSRKPENRSGSMLMILDAFASC